MKKVLGLALAALTFCGTVSIAQTGIGTTAPNASAMLDVTSTTKGVLVPRMTTAQRIAIVAPANGLLVFDITENRHFAYNGTSWEILGVPKGTIVMWSGTIATIPSGWTLCDGTLAGVANATIPDLRERFIVGAGTTDNTAVTTTTAYTVNTSGGNSNNNISLTKDQIPAHDHGYSDTYFFGESSTPTGLLSGTLVDDLGSASYRGDDDSDTNNRYMFNRARTSSVNKLTGGADASTTVTLDNRPPYYALAFIIKL
jgi:microcystin-dependent protein